MVGQFEYAKEAIRRVINAARTLARRLSADGEYYSIGPWIDTSYGAARYDERGNCIASCSQCGEYVAWTAQRPYQKPAYGQADTLEAAKAKCDVVLW